MTLERRQLQLIQARRQPPQQGSQASPFSPHKAAEVQAQGLQLLQGRQSSTKLVTAGLAAIPAAQLLQQELL
jgi:hypothetical protein